MTLVEVAIPAGHAGACWRRSERRVRLVAPHRHLELEANLVLRGRARYMIGGSTQVLGPRTLLWLFPDQEHLLIDESRDFDMWIVVFRPWLVSRYDSRLPSSAAHAPPNTLLARRLTEVAARELDATANAICSAKNDSVLTEAGLAWWMLRARHAHLAGSATSADRVHPAVRRAAELVRNDPTLGVPALARQAGLSSSQLARLFKKELGLGLSEFRNRIRLEKVSEILARAQVPLMVAALDAGFGSYAQFSRVFRRVHGMSPRYGRDAGQWSASEGAKRLLPRP
jgi:AraC-like DNA-binding protein